MATIQQKIRPFTTPNYVTVEAPPRPRQDGWTTSPTISIADLDADTLSEMCAEFRAAVFAKAGKHDPLVR